MNLDKAIEILNDWGVISEPQVDQELLDAVKLGIEALKFRQAEEKRTPYLAYAPLPGETQD